MFVVPFGSDSTTSSQRISAIRGRFAHLPTVWTHVAVAAFLTTLARVGGPWQLTGSLVFTLVMASVFGSFLYAGGCLLGDARDARRGAEHHPDRPIPQSILNAGAVSIAAYLLLGVGWLGGWSCCALSVLAWRSSCNASIRQPEDPSPGPINTPGPPVHSSIRCPARERRSLTPTRLPFGPGETQCRCCRPRRAGTCCGRHSACPSRHPCGSNCRRARLGCGSPPQDLADPCLATSRNGPHPTSPSKTPPRCPPYHRARSRSEQSSPPAKCRVTLRQRKTGEGSTLSKGWYRSCNDSHLPGSWRGCD
jgi:hypothetical protein